MQHILCRVQLERTTKIEDWLERQGFPSAAEKSYNPSTILNTPESNEWLFARPLLGWKTFCWGRSAIWWNSWSVQLPSLRAAHDVLAVLNESLLQYGWFHLSNYLSMSKFCRFLFMNHHLIQVWWTKESSNTLNTTGLRNTKILEEKE